MSLLTVGEQQSLERQGAYGCTLRCDGCGGPIVQPIVWKGKANHGDYCKRDCRDAKEGRKTKLKSKYKNGGGIDYVPLLGNDTDKIEAQIMKWVILRPHERWNVSVLCKELKGNSDYKSIRKAVDNLLSDDSLYEVGRRLSVLRPEKDREVEKEHRRELRAEEAVKRRKARKRLRLKLKAEKRKEKAK